MPDIPFKILCRESLTYDAGLSRLLPSSELAVLIPPGGAVSNGFYNIPALCQQTDADPETGCMEFEIAKGRFSFRLTAPYSEERREAARRYAKETGLWAGSNDG